MTPAAAARPDGAPERVFDGKHLRARLWTPGPEARALYVTFRQRIPDPGQFDDSGPVRFALTRGVAHLHLQSRWNDWYVNDETTALEAALAPVRARFERGTGAWLFDGRLRGAAAFGSPRP